MPEISGQFKEIYAHRIFFTKDVFSKENSILEDVMAPSSQGTTPGVLVVIDENVAESHKTIRTIIEQRISDIDHLEFRGLIDVPGGEDAKNNADVIERVLEAIDRYRIDRHSWVVIIGGGAVIDAAGFAASTAHRGVKTLKIATTVLSQLDAAIGVKNGVNRLGKKNFVGSFCVPEAVVCDEDFLNTLNDRQWCEGFSEAVKIGCLKDAEYLTEILTKADAVKNRDLDAAQPIIHRCAELHLHHITEGGDPFERNEARPLDFGHWAAHRLESMSDFQITHGEAVSIGIALDTVYSNLMGILSDEECEKILTTLEKLGLPVKHHELSKEDQLFKGLEEFREHLGGKLTITLLEGIGRPIDVHEMDEARIRESIAILSKRS